METEVATGTAEDFKELTWQKESHASFEPKWGLGVVIESWGRAK